MSYFELLSKHFNKILFGIAHSFLSGIGQSFLVALFVPYFLESFSLSRTNYSIYYSTATLAGAFSLIYMGKKIDTINLKRYSYIMMGLLAVACFILSISTTLWLLWIGLFGIRLLGQGIMTHISATATSRYFEQAKGKAISLATLGHPLGEWLWPVIVAFLLQIISWRDVYLYMTLSILLGFAPLIFILIKSNHEFSIPPKLKKKVAPSSDYTVREVLKSPRFYTIVPVVLISPFILTGLFIHQDYLISQKNWTTQWVASCFMGFAGFRISSSFIMGPLIDKFTAQKLFLVQLIPLALGLLSLTFLSTKWAILFHLCMAGLGIGFSSILKSSMWLEIYGKENLGGIRSVVSMLTAVSTAASPIIFGILIDQSFTIEFLTGMSLFLLAFTGICFISGSYFFKSPKNSK